MVLAGYRNNGPLDDVISYSVHFLQNILAIVESMFCCWNAFGSWYNVNDNGMLVYHTKVSCNGINFKFV